MYYRYGGRGIKCKITSDEVRRLWIRDKAHLMKRPSIDRINNDGHYSFNNCRFIEIEKNISESWKSPSSKVRKNRISATLTGVSKSIDHNKSLYRPVDQYTLDGCFVESFKSMTSASKAIGLNFNSTLVSRCARGEIRQVHGYVFRLTEAR